MNWPIASVLLGTLGTIVIGILKCVPRRGESSPQGLYASATDMAEIRARLVNLEDAHQQMRAELRADMKELHQLLRAVVRE